MELREIYGPVSKELAQVEREIEVQVRSMCERKYHGLGDQSFLESTVNYIFQVPGKRLRPLLVLLAARAADPSNRLDEHSLVSLAVAVELIHTASLVHDDIIDRAEFRRTQLAVNERFDTKIAVIAGDILYSQFFSILVDLKIGEGRYRRLLEIFCSVTKEMCHGEIFEHRMKSAPLPPSFEVYADVIKSKTASLMAASCQSGAIMAGADSITENSLSDYGLYLGLSYQIVDDFIDGDFQYDGGAASRIDPCAATAQRVRECAARAQSSLSGVRASVFKDKLSDLSDYVIAMLPSAV